MNAVTTRPPITKAKPTFTAPAAKPATRDFDEDDARLVLLRASSISGFLFTIFGRSAGVSGREIRVLEGLMGTVQHLRRILKDLEDELSEANADLPAFFREYVTEASHMAALIDGVEWLSGYEFHMGDDAMSAYFSAICSCCDTAIAALDEVAAQS